MYVTEVSTGEKHRVVIQPLEEADFAKIGKKRYSFDWELLKGEVELYKLTKMDDPDILGLMALVQFPAEQRLEIMLIASSVENQSGKKRFDRIAGCMIAFAGKLAVLNYYPHPCVSLVPKTELKPHYIKKYKMYDGGRQLYLEDTVLLNLIKEYDHEL